MTLSEKQQFLLKIDDNQGKNFKLFRKYLKIHNRNKHKLLESEFINSIILTYLIII